MSNENSPPPRPSGGSSCPKCGGAALPIAYGFPGPGMFEAAERGELVLVCCSIFDGQPTQQCSQCGEAFGTRS